MKYIILLFWLYNLYLVFIKSGERIDKFSTFILLSVMVVSLVVLI